MEPIMIHFKKHFLLVGSLALLVAAAAGWRAISGGRDMTTASNPSVQNSPKASFVKSRLEKQISLIESRLQKSKTDPSLYAELAEVCMRKARLLHDGASYLRAERACQRALEMDPRNYGSIRLLPWVYNGQHRFEEAVTAAQRASELEPKDPWNLGNLGDALIETGEYEKAAQTIQQMVDLRPDFASYSRAAYIRELFGDPEGAIQIMGMAVRAASSRDPEQNAWSHVQLGNLYFNMGHFQVALLHFQRALGFLPEYPSAYVGVARIQTAEKQFHQAISTYQKSIAILPTYDAVVGLGDLYIREGLPAEAAKVFELLSVIEQHNRTHNIQPETYMSLFYADHDLRLPDALEMAKKKLTHSKDIRTWDALAWSLFKAGCYQEARSAMRQAMRLGTRDALFYYHSGMIEARLGNLKRASESLQTALKINPEFHPIHAGQARVELKELEAKVALANTKKSREG
jgi:tetratricopeptide (TPR) repeat protein